MKNKRALPPTYIFLTIVVMVVIHFIFPVARVISFPWRFLGAIPLALGIVLNLIADRAFKKHQTTVKPFEESTALITSGVFRITRHPMYLGFALILIGLAVFMGSLLPYAVIAVFAITMDRVFIRVEERMLEEKFGNVWSEYRQKVRRWI
jgi:protein-S-isoprenylcysteine O-methyltransferase Ste14